MAKKPTRLYFARAVTLFCSLTLLFGGVLHDVTVVVFLNSLFFSLIFGQLSHLFLSAFVSVLAHEYFVVQVVTCF